MQEREHRSVLSPTEIATNLQRSPTQQRQQMEQEVVRSGPTNLGIKDMGGEGGDEGVDSIPAIEGMQSAQQAAPQVGGPNQTFVGALSDLKNTLRGRIYAADGSVLGEMPIRELVQAVQDAQNVSAVVFDGIITQRLVDLAHSQGVKEIYGLRASQITRRYPELMLYTAEHGVT